MVTAMSTQTLAESSRLLELVLMDSLQLLDVGDPVTMGHNVTRSLTPVGDPIPGLVQTTTLQNAVESRVESVYSIKVRQGTQISAGQAVRVVSCVQEPSLVGKVLLLDKISQNGLALLRKGVATDATVVNQEGKEAISA
ncbi:hypothetical protein PBI_MARTIN_11 [Microbacterium phage Martin]|uniref:Uncharacterized protein n=10 Tax=Ilzatvirus teagan TaxID=2845595 RepID=A0A6N0A6S3_9CAUD|nr:hypothetical protein PBI_MARTIN_11 [Microbacterium phage Martin]QBZ72234.1 hypothetical protein SEA_RIYHIL_10 [Microbacterium phage Riyhil]QDH47764.1 hypothetical protein SEA_SHEE_10 [Microbacterium phage Shee]QDP44682.1 hypothetical protein STANKTOSSA_10 [Microbacterium phage Stanktossa]QJD50513.1 hypothetical protein SEA_BEAUTPEEP30_10 [Microbacterium phage BeautPeep30]QJD50995.1 hypothetical protein SEA_PHERFERI_10 [Microbacterium phage Pherferi]QKN87828.1 hypothetical protein SEA_DOTHR